MMRMSPFSFYRTPALLFGNGTLKEVGSIAAKSGDRVLVVTGSHSLRSSSNWEVLQKSLQENNLTWREVRIEGEPTPMMVDSAVEESLAHTITTVIGIGGGSVLDAGKAIAAMFFKEGSVKEYLEGVGSKTHDGKRAPYIAIPTTAGTGSEATKNTVLSEVGREGFKKSLRHHNFVPDVAIIDPTLYQGAPHHLCGACGMDAMTQLIESYVSKGASPLTDTLALTGLTHVRESLLNVYHDPLDLDSWESMAYGAFLSGITLANAGLGLVHGLAASIGGLLPIPHGVICGVLLKGVTEATILKLLEKGESFFLKKYATLGAIFRKDASTEEEDALFLVDEISYYSEKLSLPILGTLGLREKHIEEVLKEDVNKNNPIPIEREKIKEILVEQME